MYDLYFDVFLSKNVNYYLITYFILFSSIFISHITRVTLIRTKLVNSIFCATIIYLCIFVVVFYIYILSSAILRNVGLHWYLTAKDVFHLTLTTLMELFHPCCYSNVTQRQMMFLSVVNVLERTQSFTRPKKIQIM